MLLTSSRRDRAGRATRCVVRLVVGAALAAGVLFVALAVLNPGAAIFATWAALLLALCAVDRSRQQAKIAAGRRDRLRSAAERNR